MKTRTAIIKAEELRQGDVIHLREKWLSVEAIRVIDHYMSYSSGYHSILIVSFGNNLEIAFDLDAKLSLKA